MGILPDSNGEGFPIGIAWLAGSIPSRRGPVQCWRLEVGKRPLEWQRICRNRLFERLGDAAESL